MDAHTGEVTKLLRSLKAGNKEAEAKLIPIVYAELRRLAAHHMRRERPDHTLQPTALAHEAYLRLAEQEPNWESRTHFMAVASQLMRHILIDHARSRLRQKRGGERVNVSLDEQLIVSDNASAELVALDESLERLSNLDPRQSRIVELRFFGGLTVEESALVLNISPKTVKRDWSIAKAWLYRDMCGGYGDHAQTMGIGQGTV